MIRKRTLIGSVVLCASLAGRPMNASSKQAKPFSSESQKNLEKIESMVSSRLTPTSKSDFCPTTLARG
jgi:hypothetical protein